MRVESRKMDKKIIIKGAREHNLKSIDLEIPRDRLAVFTGVSGSGKSSLAFDTLYAEGQRRYVESLSSYARQFLGQMEKPAVDLISGLSPAISIEQKTLGANPRSTVGTVTEIYDYLRVLYARAGTQYCPQCGSEISSQSVQQMTESVLKEFSGRRIMLTAPVIRNQKGEHRDFFDRGVKSGFIRARVDGKLIDLDEAPQLNKNKKHNLEIVVDRIRVKPEMYSRITDSIETAVKLSDGILIVNDYETNRDVYYNEHAACLRCGLSFSPLTPQKFSFNSPQGMCPVCKGIGTYLKADIDKIIGDEEKSILDGAIIFWGKLGEKPESWRRQALESVAEHYGFDLNTPYKDLDDKIKNVLLHGSGKEKIQFTWSNHEVSRSFKRPVRGVLHEINRLYVQTNSEWQRRYYGKFISDTPCPECGGARLKKESLAVKINGYSIADVTSLSIRDSIDFFNALELDERKKIIAEEVIRELTGRLQFLLNVGLHYLSLDREARTLSGGEARRIRVAGQIGSGLVGVLYILDEPTIGLHQRDNRRLLETLLKLRDAGNSVIVVEHDREIIEAADYILDFGPGAGYAGGRIVARGTPDQIKAAPESITGKYLKGDMRIEIPEKRKSPKKGFIKIKNASHHNLKGIDVAFPLGLFTCVTGVSGSGKSSLVADILYKALSRKLFNSGRSPGKHDRMTGAEKIDKVINIDQKPIGRTPRSNPSTYIKVYDHIRKLFAQTPEAKIRGYRPGRFSFNVKGGRCENCKGDGVKKIEMHFLPTVYVTCDVCKGKRFNRETLEVKYRGKNIADVLAMEVDAALELFRNIPPIKRHLQTLVDVGMEYVQLGQPAPTLSGGEAQRVKLARELSKIGTGNTFYILDEPTTGLHFADIKKLLAVLRRLVEKGNTVLVIEHNLDVIKTADWIIDLGPEGGDDGGYIVAEGPPEKIARNNNSYTGNFLKNALNAKTPAK